MSLKYKNDLAKFVGINGIVDDKAQASELLNDHRGYFTGKAAAIVLPQTTAQVVKIVKYCLENKLSLVPQGGNTSYNGGATPDTSGSQVLLNLKRMNKIRDVDKINFTMTVDAGIILAKVQQAAEQANMLFPLSLGAQGSCQIGGNISTNAGGLAVLRYGNCRDLVLGVEAVLANGEVLNDLNKLRKNNTGYNLSQLLSGAEGSLGIVTGAVLKTFPLPVQRCVLILAFAEIPKLCEFYTHARVQSGDCVSSFEYLSRLSVDLVLDGPLESRFPLDNQHQHYALVEFSSSSQLLPLEDMIEKILNQAISEHIVLDGVLAQSEVQCQAMWKFRESIPETERLLGGSIKHDISLPISNINEFLQRIPEQLLSITKQQRLSVYGHIGDGNLHLNLLSLEADDPGAFKQKFESVLSDCIYELTQQLDGSFSAEHGIGQLKLSKLEKYKDPVALNMMRDIKHSLDPTNIMNPGKLFQPRSTSN